MERKGGGKKGGEGEDRERRGRERGGEGRKEGRRRLEIAGVSPLHTPRE